MIRSTRALALLAACITWAGAAQATALDLPGDAHQTARRVVPLGSYALPIGPWRDGKMATLATEGPINRHAMRLPDAKANTLELLRPLRAQLVQDGYEILFECKTRDCGGFDFRFETEILSEPEMHVDLGDFRFLSARRGNDVSAEFISLMVSRSSNAGYVQVTRVGGDATAFAATADERVKSTKASARAALSSASTSTPPTSPDAFSAALEQKGGLVLDDLTFPTGATDLARDSYATLAHLAEYLKSHPDRSIVLVGHTDAEGGLSGNVEISRRRAQAVADRLLKKYKVTRAQIRAEGIGFLAPRASNLTEDGRLANRRVEAVLSSTR